MKRIFTLFLSLTYVLQGMTQTSVEDIDIKTPAQIDSLQDRIRDYIWPKGQNDFATVASVERNLSPEEQFPNEYAIEYTQAKYAEEFTNLKSIDHIVFQLKPGFNNVTYILHPKISNHFNIPIIYHGGHDGIFWEDAFLNNSGRPYSISVIDFLLGKGFDIIAIEMPLCGSNENPIQVSEDGNSYVLSQHSDIFQLKNPFYYFFEPIRKTLNFMERKYGSKKFVMIGLSGGGWTTTIYSAIDPRIAQSYSVAGSIPIPLRLNLSDIGDEEQNYEDFYKQLNYSTLYTLAAHGSGKLHYQILNVNDNCCFDLDGNKYWVPFVQQKLAELEDPGNYRFYYDPFSAMHKISSVAMDTIYSHIKNDLLSKNMPYDVNITNDSHNDIICKGGEIHLSVSPHDGDGIQWYRDNEELTEYRDSASILVDKPGVYYVKSPNISDIIFLSDTLNVQSTDVQPFITQKDDTMFSSSMAGNQWLLDGVPLINETNNWLKPAVRGSYSVVVKNKYCQSKPSLSYVYDILVYPVPSTGEINIRCCATSGKLDIEVFDINGRLILKDYMEAEKKINLAAAGKGIYFLKLIRDKTVIETKKIILF
ncbi:MAG: T9SS type A sorting domain-containing protein [Chitinophagales bacterium]